LSGFLWGCRVEWEEYLKYLLICLQIFDHILSQMKTIEKQITTTMLKGKFTKVESFPFLKGVEMFMKKIEEAKAYLANVKLPSR
jgi:hypothetical protein